MDKLTLTRFVGSILFIESILVYSLVKTRQYAVQLDEKVRASLQFCSDDALASGRDILSCEETVRQVRATADYDLAILGPFLEIFWIAFPLWALFELALYAARSSKRKGGQPACKWKG